MGGGGEGDAEGGGGEGGLCGGGGEAVDGDGQVEDNGEDDGGTRSTGGCSAVTVHGLLTRY